MGVPLNIRLDFYTTQAMKYFKRLTFPQQKSKPKNPKFEATSSTSDDHNSKRVTPLVLPHEVWRKIIRYTIRLAGSNAVDLDDPCRLPYQNDEYPDIDFCIFEDRRTLTLVSSAWRTETIEISTEYLTIYTGDELEFLVKYFDGSKQGLMGTRRYQPGNWTRRIDFKILGEYKVQSVVRLLSYTPNLLIYNNKNGPRDDPENFTPIEVLTALAEHCGQSLQRVEWSGAGEAPRYNDLAVFLNKLPNLTTLCLVAIHSYPMSRDDGVPPRIILPRLKTLSLGRIPIPITFRADYGMTWDPFVRYLSLAQNQLPVLERFECEMFPLCSMRFFYAHGHKLRTFRTTAGTVEDCLPSTFSLCPNLETFVLVQGPFSDPVEFPSSHSSLTKICIIPNIEVIVDVPPRIFFKAVFHPLEKLLNSLYNMATPNLHELRIYNLGAYSPITTYPIWLDTWWRRWNMRDVELCDQAGKSYRFDCELLSPRHLPDELLKAVHTTPYS